MLDRLSYEAYDESVNKNVLICLAHDAILDAAHEKGLLELKKNLSLETKPNFQNLKGLLNIKDPLKRKSKYEEDVADYGPALQIFRQLAENGDASAQCVLGRMYSVGIGVLKDSNTAVIWYQKAVDQGNVVAANNLGSMYIRGQGVPQDFVQAGKLFCAAAKSGDAETQNKCGILHEFGEGVPKDYEQALAWYRKAADQGNPRAQYSLGNMYYKGQGVPRDFAQAASLYQKAADHVPAAKFNMGIMMYFGRGIEKDPDAFTWIEGAALEEGISLGQSILRRIVFGAAALEGNSNAKELVHAMRTLSTDPDDFDEEYFEEEYQRIDERDRVLWNRLTKRLVTEAEKWDKTWGKYSNTELNSKPCAVETCLEFSLSKH